MGAYGCTTPPEPGWTLPGDTFADIFSAKIDRDGACHMWLGGFDAHGYGSHSHAGTTYKAHRLAYELARGPIPSGLVIDHLCANRWCVNPDHLEPVTNGENLRRGGKPHFQEVGV